MKKFLLFAIFTLLLTTSTFAKARIPIPVCFPCEDIAVIKDLPNDEALLQSGSYLNLGYLYEEYGAIFVPVWNNSGRYVLVNEAKTAYYDLSEEQLAEYKKAYDLELSSNPLSFWKKIGGKLVILLLLVLIIFVKTGSDDDDDDETKTPE